MTASCYAGWTSMMRSSGLHKRQTSRNKSHRSFTGSTSRPARYGKRERSSVSKRPPVMSSATPRPAAGECCIPWPLKPAATQSPGYTDTPGFDGLLASSETVRQRMKMLPAVVPAGRMGTPDEVAKAVVFLASPYASYISGQNLTADGSLTSRFPLPLPGVPPNIAG